MFNILRLTSSIKAKITSLCWSLFPSKLEHKIHQLSLVEYDSCWQLLQAIPHFQDNHIRSKLFSNALEELQHGHLFSNFQKQHSNQLISSATLAKIPIINSQSTKNELYDFLIFFYLSEISAIKKYKIFSFFSTNVSLKNIFVKIISDETGHEAACLSLLNRMEIKDGEFSWRLRRQKWFRFKNSFFRSLQKADWPIYIILVILYFVFGFFTHNSFKKRIALSRELQLDIFNKQISDHISSVRAV